MIDLVTAISSRLKQFYLPVIGQSQRACTDGVVESLVKELFTEV
jgi:hypothetical protein